MAFSSRALAAQHRVGRNIGVGDFFDTWGWRVTLYTRFLLQLEMKALRVSIWYYLWINVRCGSKLLAWLGCGNGDFASSTNIREGILTVFFDRIQSKAKPKWRLFWLLYFLFTDDISDFVIDYCEAWSLQNSMDMEIIMFMDNGHRLAIPCSSLTDDKALMKHLHIFYDLVRTGGGIFEFFGTRSSQRIDIVELQQTHAVGKRVGPPLTLGRHGPYNRQIHYFKVPSDLTGTHLRERLVAEHVLTMSGRQTHALNIVRTWDPYVTTIIVLLPVALSLSASVAWSVVASVYFKADAQASTQTGFTIGSYVVTAGALLIALVAFLDTKVNTGE